MRIPYFELTRQSKILHKALEKAVQGVVRSGKYILSDKVRLFETSFARYIGTRYGLGVGSGTDALIFALKACGVRAGDEVLVPSFTFSATVMAILHAGASPVFCEVDASSFTMDPVSVEQSITRKTRAILPVHLYGHPADMTRLMKLARRHNLRVIEDACQAHGAEWKGKKVGGFGDVGCFSFYPTKNLGALGDGGMTVTHSKEAAQKIENLRNLGRPSMKAPRHETLGWTSRLDALQAAALSVKLKKLEYFNESRRKIATAYHEGLIQTPLGLPSQAAGARHVYHLYVVRVPKGRRDRDALKKYLASRGIGSMIHYPYPVHRQPALWPYLRKKFHLPLTDQLSREILSLPLFPEMKESEVRTVASAVRRFFLST